MDSTDGLQRGAKVVDNGAAISVPVGNDTLGRVFNVLGKQLIMVQKLVPTIAEILFTAMRQLMTN